MIDLVEAGDEIGTGGELAGGVDRGDELFEQLVIGLDVARAELLGEELEPEVAGRFGAGEIAGVDDGRDVGRQLPGVGEHRESLLGTFAGQREAAEGVLADLDAGLVPGAGGVEGDQLHAALVDVVLGVVGDHARAR